MERRVGSKPSAVEGGRAARNSCQLFTSAREIGVSARGSWEREGTDGGGRGDGESRRRRALSLLAVLGISARYEEREGTDLVIPTVSPEVCLSLQHHRRSCSVSAPPHPTP